MTEPKNHVHLTADVPASPDDVFTYFTDQFHEVWPGEMEHVKKGKERSEPFGKGFVRRMKTAAGELDEEIVTHDRPTLIEYKVINGDEAKIHNHLGRIELSERSGGTHVDYTIAFDYRPPALGPVSAAFMKAAWRLRSRRRLARAFPG